MEHQENICLELRSMLDDFARLRDTYVALKAYCAMQDEVLAVEKERCAKVQEDLEKVIRACLTQDKLHKTMIKQLQEEKDELRKAIAELEEQCDHLRLVNTDRNGDNEEIYRLQDELEVLKSQLVLQEEKHSEELAVLKQQHSDEVQKYKMLLRNAKRETPSNQKAKRVQAKATGAKKKPAPAFKWPQLEIEKIASTSASQEEEITGVERKEKKKRKLFHEDKDAAIDII